jgi:DNA invertase Pin-like site-specific DNA recombinase
MAAKHSKRVALYLRASSDDQTESLGAQRMLLVRYAADNNLKIVGEYEDFAKSGDSCNGRDGLQQLMAVAKAGKFDGVLVRQLSRLSRRDSMKTAAQIIGPLLDAGVSIFTASHGNLELNSATGRIMLAVLCEFDHAANVSRSFNVVSGQHKAAMAGSWIGAAPYAYVIEGEKHHKRLVLNGDEALATVRRIFELYADGESAAAIANLLNAEGIPSPSGNHWTFDTVGDILQRPVYVGDHRFNYESRGKYYQLKDGKPNERFDHWVDGSRKPRGQSGITPTTGSTFATTGLPSSAASCGTAYSDGDHKTRCANLVRSPNPIDSPGCCGAAAVASVRCTAGHRQTIASTTAASVVAGWMKRRWWRRLRQPSWIR